MRIINITFLKQLEKIEKLLKTARYGNNLLNHVFFKINDSQKEELKKMRLINKESKFLLIVNSSNDKIEYYFYEKDNYNYKKTGCYLEDLNIINNFNHYKDLYKFLH